MRNIGIIYLLLTVLWVNPGLAQESAELPAMTLTLTMKDAIDLALSPDGNLSVQVAEESVRIAEARLRQSEALRNPSVDAYASEQNLSVNLRALGVRLRSEDATARLSLPSRVGPFSTFEVRLRARYDLLNIGLRRASEAASAHVSEVAADSDAQRDNVAFHVAHRYLVVLRHHATVEAAQANTELSEALLRSAQQRESAGVGTALDVTRISSQLASDQYRLAAAHVEQVQAELDLLNVLGLSLETRLRLTDSLELTHVDRPSAAEAVELARRRRADLRAQDALIARVRSDDRAIHAERLPTVDVYGDFGAVNADAERPLATHLVGVALRVPVFDGGRRAARRAEVSAQIRREELRRDLMTDLLALEMEQAVRQLSLTRQQVEVAQTGVDLAEDELARVGRRYENGLANSLEVVGGQTRLREARSNHIEALYAYNRSRVDLAQAQGDIGSLHE